VITELNATLNRLEERHALLGGAIEAAPVEHSETRKRSALMDTRAGGATAAGGSGPRVKRMAGAIRVII
jgi:hypothetical protein